MKDRTKLMRKLQCIVDPDDGWPEPAALTLYSILLTFLVHSSAVVKTRQI